jgi:glycosyltransferase involved in cell wall biosynthesis
VTGVAPEIVRDLEELFPGVRGRTAMVPPPLTRWDRIAELAGAPVEHSWFGARDVPVAGSVANIHPRKDPEALVRAMVLLNERAVRHVRLVLIGRSSDPGLRAKLMRLAAEGGIAKDVEFLGYQATPRVRRSCVRVRADLPERRDAHRDPQGPWPSAPRS